MKLRTYVLIGLAAIVIMSSGSKNAKPTVGINPGDLAPRIESFGSENSFNFQNHSGRYTLLSFWAAYDAESRLRNVQLVNEINKSCSDKVMICSVSLDENKSIFTETVKRDGLNEATQFHDEQGKLSDLYKKYRLEKGMKNFLINDKGVIIATNVTPENLTKVLN